MSTQPIKVLVTLACDACGRPCEGDQTLCAKCRPQPSVSAAQQIAAREEAKTRAEMLIRSDMRELAMTLARHGFDSDVIRSTLRELAREAADRAVAWAVAEDAYVAAREAAQ